MKTAAQISPVLSRSVISPFSPATYAQMQELTGLIAKHQVEAATCCNFCQGFWGAVELPENLEKTEAENLIAYLKRNKSACKVAEQADKMVNDRMYARQRGWTQDKNNAKKVSCLLSFQTAIAWNRQF